MTTMPTRNHVHVELKIKLPRRPGLNEGLSLADCPDCGAASGHWPSCPRYPFF